MGFPRGADTDGDESSAIDQLTRWAAEKHLTLATQERWPDFAKDVVRAREKNLSSFISLALSLCANVSLLSSVSVGGGRFAVQVDPHQGRESKPVRAIGNFQEGVQEDPAGGMYED